MNRSFVCLMLCLSIFLFSIPSICLSADVIKWYSYDEGIKLGKSQNKKIFINFYADWCGYCTKMDKTTFANPEVVAYLNKNFISIKINNDKEKNLSDQYRVRGLPSNWFLAENASKIQNYPGYLETERFLSILKNIQSESNK